jgi:hypothetical protein
MNDVLPYENPATPRGERIALCLETIGFEYSSQPKEFIAHCNLCGGATWTIITHRDRYGLLAPATACAACSLTVLNPRLNAAAYGEFYNGIYRPLVSAFHGRRIDARTIQDEQREYAAAMGEVLAPYLEGRRSASLIDVGGSTGIVAAYLMRRFGLRATVLDPAPAEVDEAKALGIETVTAFIEDWDAGEKGNGQQHQQ